MKGLRKEFPKEIWIGENVCYKVRFIRGLQKNGYMGMCCFDTKEIWISTGLTPEERIETWWHEVGHALDFEYGIKLSHRQIYKLEKPLTELFQNNAWITWAKWQDN